VVLPLIDNIIGVVDDEKFKVVPVKNLSDKGEVPLRKSM
jgi:hypothetical protein